MAVDTNEFSFNGLLQLSWGTRVTTVGLARVRERHWAVAVNAERGLSGGASGETRPEDSSAESEGTLAIAVTNQPSGVRNYRGHQLRDS